MGLSAAQRTLFEKSRRAGTGAQGVGIDDAAAHALMATVARDLSISDTMPAPSTAALPDFYTSDPADFGVQVDLPPLDTFERLVDVGPDDVDTYFSCLATLHKARLKYEIILSTQSLPTLDQVGPRGLLQYGTVDTGALVALLFLRKWMYDVDNRAAQETGYLFEPIIAAAIGGVPVSARKSPVTRRNGKGGRQVDCLRGDDAYEFKLRVTIAASGQGRWGEELEFPLDARASGFRPVLIVFDATPNAKLTELTQAFESAGGSAYVGNAAWAHLDEAAGTTMSVFLETYVRAPLQDLLESVPDVMPSLTITLSEERAVFDVGKHTLAIDRVESLGELAAAEDPIPDDVDEGLPGV